MSATTEAIEMIDALQKAKIPKQTATKLIDYVEKRKDKTVNLQWVAIGILSGGLIAIFGLLWQLSLTVATKQDMQVMETRVDKRFDKIENLIKEKK